MRKQFLLLFLIVLFPFTANAAIVYTTYGLGDSHSEDAGWAVLNNVEPPYYPENTDWDTGMKFSFSDGMFALESINVTVGLVTGSNELDAWLMSDINGVPGDIVESFHLSNSMSAHSWYEHHEPITFQSSLNPILYANTDYWLVLSTPVDGTFVNWYHNSEGIMGPRAVTIDGSWNIANGIEVAAFNIEGAQVPIPAAVWLFGSGLIGIVSFRRKFRND